jgi:hypothetical protein
VKGSSSESHLVRPPGGQGLARKNYTKHRFHSLNILVLCVGINRAAIQSWESFDRFVLKPLAREKPRSLRCVFHLAQGGAIYNPRSGESGNLEELVPQSSSISGTALYDIEDIRKNAEALVKDINWSVDPWKDGFKSSQNLLSALILQKKAAQSLLDSNADCVIITRPDLRFFSGIPIESCVEAADGSGPLFPRWGGFGGVNDRLAVLSRPDAMVYLNRIDQVSTHVREVGELHSERFLAWMFKHSRPRAILNTRFARLRLGGRVEPKDRFMGLPLGVGNTLQDVESRLKRVRKLF